METKKIMTMQRAKRIRYQLNANLIEVISDVYTIAGNPGPVYYFYVICSNSRILFRSYLTSTIDKIRYLLFDESNKSNYIYITDDLLETLGGELQISIETPNLTL